MLAACSSIGPGRIERDQPDYAAAIHEAAKQQMLLNLLRVRYGELPSIVNVTQIIAGYETRGRLQIGSNFFTNDFSFADDFSFVTEGYFTDRPTITLQPLRGSAYARGLLRPIPPNEILALVLAGGDVEAALALGIQRINGITNDALGERPFATPGDGRFGEIVRLVAALRDAALIQLEFEGSVTGRSAYLSFAVPPDQTDDPRIARLIQLLELDPTTQRYMVRFGLAPTNGSEIVILTRSLLDVFSEVAATIDVPEAHIKSGRTHATRRPSATNTLAIRFAVEGGQLPRIDAFASTRFAGHRFWINEDDFESKRIFAMLMLFSTLLDPTVEGTQPLITIPTG